MAATIYFAGTEDIDFGAASGTVVVNTTAADLRTTFVRAGLSCSAAAAADPPTNRFPSPTFTAITNPIWIHGQFAQLSNSNSTTLNCQALQVLDGGVARILVRGTGTAGQLKISTRNAAGTITDLVTGSSAAWPASTAPLGFDLFINYAVAGQVTLYIGGVQVATFSGDVTTNSATTLNQVIFGNPTNTAGWVWSEIIVANADTRSKGLWLMNTASAGNADGWTGTLGNVNKSSLNDATFVSSASAAQIQEYLIASAPAGTYAVDAVVMSARALVGTTGPQHFDFVTRVGGTDYLSADQVPTTSFSNFPNVIRATNPSTTADWLLSDLTAAGVNYGVESKA